LIASMNVVGDDGERGVNFVGHTGGEQAQRSELSVWLICSSMRSALRDIVEEQETAMALRFTDQRSNGDVEGEDFPW